MTNSPSNVLWHRSSTGDTLRPPPRLSRSLSKRSARNGANFEDDLSSLKKKDDLVTQRAAKYGLEKWLAKRDVDALMNGRQSDPEASCQRAPREGPDRRSMST